LPVVLYGCETWSLTLREGLDKRVLRKILGPNRNEITRQWRRLRNEERRDLYCSRNIIRVIKSRTLRWAGHVTRTRNRRGAYRVVVRRPEGKTPLARPRRRCDDNNKMGLQEGMGRHGVD